MNTSSNRLIGFGVGLIVLLFLGYASIFVVNARQQAVVLRFGRILEVKSEPGLYFKLPFSFMDADQVRYVQDQALRFDLDNIRLQVKGGKFYEVDAFVVYRITDPRKFMQTVSGDRDAAESRLRTRLDAALRRVYGLRDFDAALSAERATMMTEVRDSLHRDAESLGLNIEDVRIRRTDLTQEVSSQTFERMKAERLAEAELIRARGNEEAQRRRAVADRQAVGIVADARRDSDILHGEGDAESTRIFAAAYQKDPAFFSFYRSMRAYKEAFGQQNTTMVLSPESDFFRYFNRAQGNASAGAPSLAPPAAASTPPANSAP